MDKVKKRSYMLALFPLILVLFIDGMGQGLIFPLLNSLLLDPNTSLVPKAMTADTRHALYGITISVFLFCWFFGAPIISDMSDKSGRKKALMLCLVGTFAGYILSIIAIVIHSLGLLILGRVLDGFTAGSQPVAQAAAVDVSPEEGRPKTIGLFLAAITLGMIIGPAIGAVFSNSGLVSWFSISTPFYVAAILSAINFIMLGFFFKETFHKHGKMRIKLSRAIMIFKSAFQHKAVRKLSTVWIFLLMGWSSYITFAPFFMHERFGVSTQNSAWFMALIGAGASLGFIFLVNFFTKRFQSKKIIITAFSCVGLFALLSAVSTNPLLNWLLAAPAGAAAAVGYSTVMALYANTVSPEEQGWVMGITGAILAFCWGLVSLVSAFAANLNIAMPMYITTIATWFGALLFLFYA